MPMKTKEEQSAYGREHYRKNKAAYRERDRERKRKARMWLQDYKEERGCKFCEENHPACLHFHHRESQEKDATIATMISNRASIAALKAEMKKCHLVCANCHAKIHWNIEHGDKPYSGL